METQTKPLSPESKTVNVLGATIIYKARSEDTQGAYSLFEVITPAGFGPPPHTHSREDEAFYILEGTIQFQIGDQSVTASSGTFVQAPRNITHSYKNIGDTPGRMLIWYTPAGMEGFFDEASQLPAGPPDKARLAEIFAKYGCPLAIPPVN